MENQKTIDARIWNEIVGVLCEKYGLTRHDLYTIFAVTYPKWLDAGRDLFLDMNNKTFWREIPRAIRRRQQMWGMVSPSANRSNKIKLVGVANGKEI